MKMKNISVGLFACFFSVSCDQLVEVPVQKSQIIREVVFENDNTATSAVLGIYSDMYSDITRFASGGMYSVSGLCALSSDELVPYYSDLTLTSFWHNDLKADNPYVLSLWSSLYYSIYSANSVLDGLRRSSSVTESVKMQLEGEAFFIRAFCYFYLVNVFGEVPLVTTINYEENAKLHKSSVDDIYATIISDLTQSKSLLSEVYVSERRVRPNRAVAGALLSRVYMYLGRWSDAILESSALIDDPDYDMVDINSVFLRDSHEAIWQLMPMGVQQNTNEGNMLILTNIPGLEQPFALDTSLVNSFEELDQRKINWVNQITIDQNIYYYPFKYKIAIGGTGSVPYVALTEYSMVFRIAEQYLIRSEAKANIGDVDGAIGDLDVVRDRCGLSRISDLNPTISFDDLMLAIERERRLEFFTEWGHRWFDLKRTNRLDSFLADKMGWNDNDALYPIPQKEIDRSLGLDEADQNVGY